MDPAMTKLPLNDKESQWRTRLGIPEQAKSVMILAKSSHWDPNWLYTSEKYYTRFVDSNLQQAVFELDSPASPDLFGGVHVLFAHVLGKACRAAGNHSLAGQ